MKIHYKNKKQRQANTLACPHIHFKNCCLASHVSCRLLHNLIHTVSVRITRVLFWGSRSYYGVPRVLFWKHMVAAWTSSVSIFHFWVIYD